MNNRRLGNYSLFIIFFMIFQLLGCGCENKYALKASFKELRETKQFLNDIENDLDNLSINIDSLTTEKMYLTKQRILKKMSKIKIILYWSKNIDQVLENPQIIVEMKEQKLRLKRLESDFQKVELNFAKLMRKDSASLFQTEETDEEYEDEEETDDEEYEED